MSSVVIAGDTSGSITLAAPAVAGSNTITLPASTGTALVAPTALTVPNTTGTVMVSGNMPAFSAYRNASQNPSANTWTKIQFNAEEFDTASCFDSTTNYRFTPNVAGYYQVSLFWLQTSGTSYNYCSVYKNGTSFKAMISSGASGTGVGISTLIYLNGSTDYIEGYMFTDSGGISASSNANSFQAVLVRAA